MELNIHRLVRKENGLFLPDTPTDNVPQVIRGEITEETRYEGLEDFLTALHKDNFPFGLIVGLRTLRGVESNTNMSIYIPHPSDIVYFLDAGKVTHWDELIGKEVDIHHAGTYRTFGVTFPKD